MQGKISFLGALSFLYFFLGGGGEGGVQGVFRLKWDYRVVA